MIRFGHAQLPRPDDPVKEQVQPAFSVQPGAWPEDREAGDLVLIRWFLQMTPQQRLAYLQQAMLSLSQLRDAAAGA